jgi:lipopolysaccharide transport system ATP-binding protein
MEPAISVERLSKLYRIGHRPDAGYRTLRESLAAGASALWRGARRGSSGPTPADAAADDLWALRDVSFEVQPGEVIGIVGRNGAGKSTLLKVLSQITEPHSGRVTLRGRVGSLLEVGVGFHHELTGRENIYLNGTIFGMSRRDVARKFDAIVDFAEVERFLDTPVKRYSSGMYMRLAFAVACHLEPEILLVDEVLAVGDSAFQRKCLGKMDEVSRTGRTVIFVSHNMGAVLNLCKRVLLLERGRLAFDGPCEEGVERYVNSGRESTGGEVDLSEHPNRRNGCKPILGRLQLLDGDGRPTDQVPCGEPVSIALCVDPRCPIAAPEFGVGIDDVHGNRLFTAATYLSDSVAAPAGKVPGTVCHLDHLPLTPGRYAITLNAGTRYAAWTDVIDQALWFDVIPTDYYGNGRVPNPEWGRYLVRSRWTASEAMNAAAHEPGQEMAMTLADRDC